MRSASIVFATTLAVLSQSSNASSTDGTSFVHKDWQLVCDNTRTCRAAGYSIDGSELPISVLLTRKAGPNQPVTGEVMVGRYDENPVVDKLPSPFSLSLSINDQTLGSNRFDKNSMVAKLSAKQVASLLSTLKGTSEIRWTDGNNFWELSNQGAAAVLLKMDEYQGRIGTKGAIMRKGAQEEERVLPPLPIPEVVIPPFAKPAGRDPVLTGNQLQALRKALTQTLDKDDNCPAMTEPENAGDAKRAISFTRLNEKKILASTPCWSGAYNTGSGYWVIDNGPDFNPVLVTTEGSDFNDGSISSAQKGRGLGDCWYSDEWVWNGQQFIHTESSSTGLCRLLAPGGGWSLPTIVTNVRRLSR